MKHNLFRWIFLTVFLLASLTLSLGMLIAGPSQVGANEQLSRTPVLTNRNGKWNPDILSDTADWISDHFFLRQELISLDNLLSATLTHTSGASDVILGNNGWLYYAPTLDDYTGQALMTERDLFCAAKNLDLMEEYCQNRGQKFVFLIAPNKNSLYPAQMPAYTTASPNRNAQRLFARLDAQKTAYIDLFSLFQAQTEVLYFTHDSHWNSRGAALGADAINAAFDRTSSYFTGDFSAVAAHRGDLYEMLYPAFQDPEHNPVYGGTLDFTYAGSATAPDSITLLTESDGEGTLLAYRDSFGNLLYPYLADSFSSARFSRSVSYDLTEPADCVLIELVERNLPYLIANLPVMPSPQREVTLPETVSGTVKLTASEKAPEGYIRLTGALPQTPDADSCVYVSCAGTVYEAFLTESDGFGVYVPADTPAETLAFCGNGQFLLYQIQMTP